MSLLARGAPLVLASVALTATTSCGGSTDANTTTGGQPPRGPTFYEDVAPIVYENCIGCHTTDGIAPFSLVKWEDAVSKAGLMKADTASRKMPPWHVDNSGACNTYKDARWLTDAQIATIGAWADAGALEGDPKNGPALPPDPKGLDTVSATLDAPIYTPDSTLTDDYRCFLVDPGVTTNGYITGYEVKPGEKRTVHHVIVYGLSDATAEQAAQTLDDAEAGPGYTCFGGPGVSGAKFIAGWAPGTPVTYYPDGTGLAFSAGRKMIVQIHYNLANGVFQDHTTIDLKMAPTVAKPAQVAPILDHNLSLPPNQPDVEQTFTIANPAPIPVYVQASFPHMHKLGRTLEVDLLRNNQPICVVKVPAWDFNWQQLYQYEKPLEVLPGDSIRITCGYDTMGQTNTVTWGEGTTDEMCLNFVYVTQ